MKIRAIFQKSYVTDRPTDRPTDRQTDIAASRVAFTRLKKKGRMGVKDEVKDQKQGVDIEMK